MLKYLLTYNWSGEKSGQVYQGPGSCPMTIVEGKQKITEETIKDACRILEERFVEKGFVSVSVTPMGWFKYDE